MDTTTTTTTFGAGAARRAVFMALLALAALLFLCTAAVRWVRSLGGSHPPPQAPPLAPEAAADAHYRRMRSDLQRDTQLGRLAGGDARPKLWVHLDRERNGRDWAGTCFRTNRGLNRPYLRACLRSVRRHNAADFRILYIDDRAFQRLLPDWPHGDLTAVRGDERRRALRAQGQLRLLHLYGGMQVPAAFWCRRPLRPTFDAALAGGGEPFCVRLPAPTAARPLLPPAGDAPERAAWPCDLRAEELAAPAAGGVSCASGAEAAALALGMLGCRPGCPQVARLIEQLRFETEAAGESREVQFHRLRREAVAVTPSSGIAPRRALCAGRWAPLALRLDGANADAKSAPPDFDAPQTTAPRERAELRALPPALVGREDCRGDAVTLAQLLGATPVQFRDDALGVWIPEDELLASRRFDWFPGMGLRAMRGFVLAGLLAGELASDEKIGGDASVLDAAHAAATDPLTAVLDDGGGG
jgi:hypothetical protein